MAMGELTGVRCRFIMQLFIWQDLISIIVCDCRELFISFFQLYADICFLYSIFVDVLFIVNGKWWNVNLWDESIPNNGTHI